MRMRDARGIEHDSTKLRCIGCGKEPKDLSCYAAMIDPEQDAGVYVLLEEGTLGMKGPNTFYCDDCYIQAGQPLWPR